MGWLRTVLARLFGGAGRREGDVLWVTVECDRCHEQVTIRIDKRTDIQSEYLEAGDSGPWYTLHKEVMDNKCFALMHLFLEFDQRRAVLTQQVTGGKLVRLDTTRPDGV